MNSQTIPDSTAVRVALWRALHMQIDSAPYIIEDGIGLKMAAPPEGWQQRPDMHPVGTKGYRASIVGRARVIEDLVLEQVEKGVDQYVILGAGLDSFAQRRPQRAANLKIFEIDKPETQKWKQSRLKELGYATNGNLKFVGVDFESGDKWPEKLKASGFDARRPAVLSSTGVAMYLNKETNLANFREIAALGPGSVLALTFMLPVELVDPLEQEAYRMVQERAKASGTPFLSFFTPEEILGMARAAGFKSAKHISRDEIVRRYFMNRSDGFKPSSGEEFLIATV